MTKLQCQSCSAQLDPSNKEKNIITCKYCGSTYQFKGEPQTPNDDETQLVAKTALKPIKPDHLTIESDKKSISITRIWRKKNSFVLLAISSVWLYIVISQIIQSLLIGFNPGVLFLVLFVIIGGLMFYRGLSEVFNKSILQVDRQNIELNTRPFTWKGDFAESLDEIKYFEIVPPTGPAVSPSTRQFRVCAINKEDMRLTLISGLTQPGHAIYLLREINAIAQKQ